MKKFLFFCMVLAASLTGFAVSSWGAEFIDGRIRLVINESTGRFSLYYMTDIAQEQYQPFFVDADPRTSFLALMVNNRNYRMGESSAFKTRLGGTPSNPALIFESSFLTVTEEFAFIRTGSSALTNGIRITITITNRGEQPVNAGVRFLIDTLGEKPDSAGIPHFATNLRQITGESLIETTSADTYWIARNSRLALMGSVAGNNITRPDSIYFANWKRLNDAAWKPAFVSGRNFNLLPYSIGDSAVCYYYEPVRIDRGASRTIGLVLSSEDQTGFDRNSVPDELSLLIEQAGKLNGNLRSSIQTDLIILRDLVNRLDRYMASGASVPDDDLDAIGLIVSKIRSKYGIP